MVHDMRSGQVNQGHAGQTRRIAPALVVVCVLIALYVVNFGALSILKHAAFQTHTADLGNMDQPIWNTLHGRFVEETKDDGTQGTRLTDHVEPIFAPVSLSFLVYDGVESILIVQTLFIALGALPVYWLARRRLKSEWAAVVFAAIYLMLPALQAANLTEFHAVPLAVAPLLFAFHFSEEEKPHWMWLSALLAMSVKEEISLLTFMIGLYLVLFRKAKLHGALLALVSLGWFAATTFVIIPHYSASGISVYVGRYESLGGSFGGVLRSALTEPLALLRLLLNGDRLLYLAGLLAGTGFLALFSPACLVMSAPVLLANVLSDYSAMFSGEFHYSAPVMPFIIVAAIYGAGWLTDQACRRGWDRSKVLGALTVWGLLWGLGYNYARGFLPWSVDFEVPQITAHHRLFARFASQIPPGAVLSTTPPLFPHLSHRPVIYLFPVIKDAEFVLVDVSGVTDMHPNDVREAFREMTGRGTFGIVDAADGYVLLRRGYQGVPELPDAFYDFARVKEPKPQYATEVDFGPYLRLRGFDLSDRYRWRLTTVRLYWEVLQPLPQDAQVYPFFLNDAGQIVEDTHQRPMVAPLWYPPSRWRAGEVIVTDTLPWDLGDAFTLAVGVSRGTDWAVPAQRLPVKVVSSSYVIRPIERSTAVRLLRFERQRGRLHLTAESTAMPPARMDRTINANLANQITLLGADLKMSQDSLQATLFWQARASMEKDYTVFVHLLAPDGTLVGQHDGMPRGSSLPTSVWLSGEIVSDEHTLKLDPRLPAGDYRLEVGLYSLDNMERLLVLDATGKATGNSIDLGTITRKS